MKLSHDYIRGLVEGEGSFTFSSNIIEGRRCPTFAIGMHVRDRELLESVRDTMGLKNKVYIYGPPVKKDGYKRGGRAILIVREFGPLKNIIIPFFYKKLAGNKRKQFDAWLEKIGSDPTVPEYYKLLHRLHKSGFYDRNPKF